MCGQLRIVVLCGQRLGPVAREPVVAVAVVGLTDFTPRAAVMVEDALRGGIYRAAQDHRLGIVACLTQEFEAFAQSTELAQTIPAQVVLFHQLLHVFGGRAASTGFKEAAALHQFDDGEHLGRGAKLKDREEVGEIVAQHVAGDGNGIAPRGDFFQRDPRGFGRGHDGEAVSHAFGLKNGGDVFDQLGVMGAVGIQPEDRLTPFDGLAVDGQLNPVFDGRFAGIG